MQRILLLYIFSQSIKCVHRPGGILIELIANTHYPPSFPNSARSRVSYLTFMFEGGKVKQRVFIVRPGACNNRDP